jgi:hypothetical protein
MDLVDKLNDPTVRDNERNNYVFRLEAIRDYTTTCLNTYSRDKQSFTNRKKVAK